MKKLLPILAILFLTTPLLAETYTVKYVIDGDTLELSNGETVRLIGIDTPEVYSSDKLDRDSKRTGKDIETIIAMGKEASDFVRGLVEGKEVKLEFDVQKRDKYGRLLAYVYVPVHSYSHISRDANGNLSDFELWDVADTFSDEPKGIAVTAEFLNAYIIRNGYATPMTVPPNVKYAELFEKFYREAREKKRGFWK